jgi:glycosyltransferase involved in cell wall biosynthesis
VDEAILKILFCSQTDLSRELGASKVLIELAEEMERIGWSCTLLGPRDIAPGLKHHGDYPIHLRHYLMQHAAAYDVVEYDHNHLPYPRTDFPRETLFVARSVLLAHHFGNIEIPRSEDWKSVIRSLTVERKTKARDHDQRKRAHQTVCQADLVNVLNNDDKAELIRHQIPDEKITVIPNGISRNVRKLFDSVSSVAPAEQRVAFVGTFDNRKGALDFPHIVRLVCAAVPRVRFRFLGTYVDRDRVLGSFPLGLRSQIEVFPRYAPHQLPGLLASCSVGVFPSYLEGFGLGVLEMLAASIPVFAYNTPGPPMMLPPEYLVRRGDSAAMAEGVIRLLTQPSELASARNWAKGRSSEFCWIRIARQTNEIYKERWRTRQIKLSA